MSLPLSPPPSHSGIFLKPPSLITSPFPSSYRTTDRPFPRGEVVAHTQRVSPGYYDTNRGGLVQGSSEDEGACDDFVVLGGRRYFRTGDIAEVHFHTHAPTHATPQHHAPYHSPTLRTHSFLHSCARGVTCVSLTDEKPSSSYNRASLWHPPPWKPSSQRAISSSTPLCKRPHPLPPPTRHLHPSIHPPISLCPPF